jgi:hypothetical protein
MLSNFEFVMFFVGVCAAYSIFIHMPRRRAFLAVLKDADPDTWIAINRPDGIIEKAGDDHLAVRLRLTRYLWRREYVSQHNANLIAAADRLRSSSAISFAIGAPAMAVILWFTFYRT